MNNVIDFEAAHRRFRPRIIRATLRGFERGRLAELATGISNRDPRFRALGMLVFVDNLRADGATPDQIAAALAVINDGKSPLHDREVQAVARA